MEVQAPLSAVSILRSARRSIMLPQLIHPHPTPDLLFDELRLPAILAIACIGGFALEEKEALRVCTNLKASLEMVREKYPGYPDGFDQDAAWLLACLGHFETRFGRYEKAVQGIHSIRDTVHVGQPPARSLRLASLASSPWVWRGLAMRPQSSVEALQSLFVAMEETGSIGPGSPVSWEFASVALGQAQFATGIQCRLRTNILPTVFPACPDEAFALRSATDGIRFLVEQAKTSGPHDPASFRHTAEWLRKVCASSTHPLALALHAALQPTPGPDQVFSSVSVVLDAKDTQAALQSSLQDVASSPRHRM